MYPLNFYMLMLIDKNTIRKLDDLPIESVATRLGLMVTRHRSICPFHDDQRPSLTYHRARNRYHCFVCEADGGSIDLVMRIMNMTFVEACRWLADQNGICFNDTAPVQRPRISQQKKADKVIDVAYLESLIRMPVINSPAQRFLYDERKINPRVVKWLGISSITYACQMTSLPKSPCFNGPSLLIPYRDIDGKLLTLQARYLGNDKDKPRFQFPKDTKCGIYNLPILKLLGKDEPLFITEGVTDCMAMLSAGHKAIAIPSATLLKPSDVEPLRALNLHMYPDADVPGESLYFQLKECLPQLVRHNLPSGFKDVGQLWATTVKNVNVNC